MYSIASLLGITSYQNKCGLQGTKILQKKGAFTYKAQWIFFYVSDKPAMMLARGVDKVFKTLAKLASS
jgi:hypothetical protein